MATALALEATRLFLESRYRTRASQHCASHPRGSSRLAHLAPAVVDRQAVDRLACISQLSHWLERAV